MNTPTGQDTASSYFYDYESREIQEIIADFRSKTYSLKERIAGLYLRVRDGWRYNPYRISLRKEDYRASYIARKKDGHCIDKSILLISCYRALGIPARIHLAKVKNHIGVERFVERFGNSEITPHGMLDVWNGEKWVKASPAFNAKLCELQNVAPLDFDGEADSLFQEFDRSGNQFMAYLEDYGTFDDVPLDFIKENFLSHYPIAKEKLMATGVMEF